VSLAACPTGVMATIYMPFVRGVKPERIIALITIYTPLSAVAAFALFALYFGSNPSTSLGAVSPSNGGTEGAIDASGLLGLMGRAALIVLIPMTLSAATKWRFRELVRRSDRLISTIQPLVLFVILWITVTVAAHGPGGFLSESGPGAQTVLFVFVLSGLVFVLSSLAGGLLGKLLPGAQPQTLALAASSRNIQVGLVVAVMLVEAGAAGDIIFLPLLIGIPWHHLTCGGLTVIFPARKKETTGEAADEPEKISS